MKSVLLFIQNALFTRRGLLILAGFLAFSYAVVVLFYVQSIPDLGLHSAFSPVVLGKSTPYMGVPPQEKDTVTEVGDIAIKNWADLLNAPFRLRDRFQELGQPINLPWAQSVQLGDGEPATAVRITYKDLDEQTSRHCWYILGRLPLRDLIPSILWFILEVTLFSVGALVLWKRPADNAAAQFFLLCIVTLGAFMGGY